MKCRDLTQFEEYYNQYIAIVFKLPDPLNEKWKNLFLNSLPSWFVQRLNRIWPPVNGQSSFKGQPFGLIKQAVHAEILDTCKEIKFQKAVHDPMKSGTYRALCKQRNLPPPAFDEKIQRSSHSSKHSSSKKTSKRGGKYHKYHGKYHKSHQKHHDKTEKTRKEKHYKHVVTGKDKKHRKEVKCFKCGGKHYANECKEKDTSKKLNEHREDSDYATASEDENCSCYGTCKCSVNVLTHEHKKCIELLSQGIAIAQYQQTK